MKSFIRMCRALLFFTIMVPLSNVNSYEWSILSKIDARMEYKDNAPNLEDDKAVSGARVSPSISGRVSDEDWGGRLEANATRLKYDRDDRPIDTRWLRLTGYKLQERSRLSTTLNYSLQNSLDYSLQNSLDADSDNLETSRAEIEKKKHISHLKYAYYFTPRISGDIAYNNFNVDYDTTQFQPYILETITGQLIYDLSAQDELTFSLSNTDYESKDHVFTYETLTTRLGLRHSFTENLEGTFSLGLSRAESGTQVTTPLYIFGVPVVSTSVVPRISRNSVGQARFIYESERGYTRAEFNRDETSNISGGLSREEKYILQHHYDYSTQVEYVMGLRYHEYRAYDTGVNANDVDLFQVVLSGHYIMAKNFKFYAKYSHVRRDFLNAGTDEAKKYDFNIIYVGMSYQFSPLSSY